MAEATVLRDLQSMSERFEAPGGFVEGLQIYIAPEGVSVYWNHMLFQEVSAVRCR